MVADSGLWRASKRCNRQPIADGELGRLQSSSINSLTLQQICFSRGDEQLPIKAG